MISRTELRSSPYARELHEAYRSHSIGSKLREHSIKQVLATLYSAGIEPILVKGWAIALLYPEPGLRPYGDIDLIVRPGEYLPAKEAIGKVDVPYLVDLHAGFGSLDYRPFDELYARSRVVKLDDVDVRVLAPEDHLRLLCVHMLRHSAYRPLWLCDIGAAVENRPADFDWAVCLGNDKVRGNWIETALALAHQLLGAQVEDTPAAARSKNLPHWLVSAVLKQWETPYNENQAPSKHRAPMSKYLRDPRGLLADLRRRWPNPIGATVYVGDRFNKLPRFPYQVGECVGRTARFAARLPKAISERQ